MRKIVLYVGIGFLLFFILACGEPKGDAITADNVNIDGTYEGKQTTTVTENNIESSTVDIVQYRLVRGENNTVTGGYWLKGENDSDFTEKTTVTGKLELMSSDVTFKSVDGTLISVPLKGTIQLELKNSLPDEHGNYISVYYTVLENGNELYSYGSYRKKTEYKLIKIKP